MRRDHAPLREQHAHHWHGILVGLGVPASALVNKHGPCPVCGGNDRFRFDDKEGLGTFICSHCGAGDGPKLAMLFVMIPEPVKAAMLFYVAGFIMAQGCQLVSARLLDTRRMLIVAFGMSAGIAVAVAPQAFISAAPILASALSVGAVVAFLMNIVTLPTVSKKAAVAMTNDAGASGKVKEWVEAVAGSWALKRQTAANLDLSLSEFTGLLLERGVQSIALSARLAEDRVEITMTWEGEPLPSPPQRAGVEDLMGSDAERHGFAVWLATRQAHGFRQRRIGEGGNEMWLAFED